MFDQGLKEWAVARGYGLAIADVGVVEVVRRKLEERRTLGMIDPGFYAEHLAEFRFLEGTSIAGPRCLVMVAVPSPIRIVTLRAYGRTMEALIPPTYVRYNATFQDVLEDMKANGLAAGVQAEILRAAPLKSLAAHAGLVAYGRNNITYAPGLGSGHQLCAYVVGTDGAAGPGASGSAAGRETVLERCGGCTACLKACPTGAIRADRFLLSAERCFTLASESRRPMPDWARRPRSLCLIGCLDCQLVCPENKGRLTRVPSGLELTGAEAEAVIEAGRGLAESGLGQGQWQAAGAGPTLAAAAAKYAELGLTEGLDLVSRNLAFYLDPGK